MSFYWLVLGILVVWRITHFLNAEDGPWDLMVRLRRKAGDGLFGQLLDCFYCLSLWIAIPFAWIIGTDWAEQLILWPALSAGAIILERITLRKNSAPPAPYFEDGEEQDELLRPEEESTSRKLSKSEDT